MPSVLVTGATSGLGERLARELAAAGWDVIAHGRDAARARALADELGEPATAVVALSLIHI